MNPSPAVKLKTGITTRLFDVVFRARPPDHLLRERFVLRRKHVAIWRLGRRGVWRTGEMVALDSGSPPVRRRDSCRRILIVEDDRVSAMLLRRVLELRGHVVDHAANGREALKSYREHRHRVVITDWMMPEMDGVELCGKLRKEDSRYVYVILLTAKTQRDERLEAFQAGVDDFLTKPLDRDELLTRLQVAARIISSEDALEEQRADLQRSAERLEWSNRNIELASQRFEELFNGLPVACFTFDNEGLVYEWNRAAEALFELPAHDAFQNPVTSVFADEEHPVWNEEVLTRVMCGEAITNIEWIHLRPDGTVVELCTNLLPIRGTMGGNLGGISVCLDVTERKKGQRMIEEQMVTINQYAEELQHERESLMAANERLGKLALTDGLTNLWNHRHFQEQLSRACKDVGRRKRPLSLVMIDVDRFKQYNDAHGHPAGDAVLKTVANILKATTREGFGAARYGGEEFVLFLDDTSRDGAMIVAERLRSAMAGFGWTESPVTASFGVSTCDDADAKPEVLIGQADEALYVSKVTGRNRVTHYDSCKGKAGSTLEPRSAA
jgi:two-component system, cell cycle response regulator